MTSSGEIKHTEFVKSVIKSVASLSYEEAQNRMDDMSQKDEISESLRLLNNIAKIIRKGRIEKGAIELASTEVKFKVEQQTKDPTGIEQYQFREANFMVEEFMLLANVASAQRIFSHFPNCALLRRHPPPLPHRFDDLKEIVGKKGFDLNVETSKELAVSLDHARDPANPVFNTILRILTTRCMSTAVYFSTGGQTSDFFYHYGLAAPIYTHFTSPIRRYADVVVHRLLAASIGVSTLAQNFDNTKATFICNGINRRSRAAQYAERESAALHTLLYFKNRTTSAEGYIIRLRSNGFVVFVPRYGVEGPVFVAAKDDINPFTFNESEHSLSCGSLSFSVFDKVVVEISVDESNCHTYKLKMVCVDPVIPTSITGESNLIDSEDNITNVAEDKNNTILDNQKKEKKAKRIKLK